MLFFRSYFFKGSETDLNKLVQKQLALNSTRVTLESFQPIVRYCAFYEPPICNHDDGTVLVIPREILDFNWPDIQ